MNHVIFRINHHIKPNTSLSGTILIRERGTPQVHAQTNYLGDPVNHIQMQRTKAPYYSGTSLNLVKFTIVAELNEWDDGLNGSNVPFDQSQSSCFRVFLVTRMRLEDKTELHNSFVA